MLPSFNNVKRCGIIPYCEIDDNNYKILLGLKTNYGKCYGDIGGGIKKNESYLSGLIREIFEESSTLIFTDSADILDMLSLAKTVVYQTKNNSGLFLEFLVPIIYSEIYVTSFLDHDIKEHCELRWFDVKRVNDKFEIINLTKQELDGSIKPLIEQILASF